ncbi:OPT/YSL family transporter, partial [candidate division KSB1 bacterium]|nr:OPT/YSL family transporter [candidate division KSB1 bacterium]
GGEMAWPLVIAGMLFAIALILLNAPSPMLISVGMYLPFTTTSAIFIGGVIKWILDKMSERRIKDESQKNMIENTGLLLASGLVAGEALTGILFAGLYASDISLRTLLGFSETFEGFWMLGVLVLLGLGYYLIRTPLKRLAQVK